MDYNTPSSPPRYEYVPAAVTSAGHPLAPRITHNHSGAPGT